MNILYTYVQTCGFTQYILTCTVHTCIYTVYTYCTSTVYRTYTQYIHVDVCVNEEEIGGNLTLQHILKRRFSSLSHFGHLKLLKFPKSANKRINILYSKDRRASVVFWRLFATFSAVLKSA